MSEIAAPIREKMMFLLKDEEQKTDLQGLSIISRIGMKIVSANSMELDADASSASCTALIDLGLRLSDATNHGSLTEIVLHNAGGYSIVVAINDEFIIFCGLKAQPRIGYYLGYLRELAIKLRILISGEEITELSMKLEESKAEKAKQEEKIEEEKETTFKPSIEQDKAALDGLLTFLDDWDAEEKAAMGVIDEFEDLEGGNNIVSIPGTAIMGTNPPSSSQSVISSKEPQFEVYEDEVPPIPLEDYTPMEIEDETRQEAPVILSQAETLPPFDNLPSFDEINVPDFDSISKDTEYDVEFVLDEESDALDSVLKDLGWDEEN
ncbi:MAG: hypothetical protein JW891_08305 [Candidatus Lokiarchaeota archaeon]|nr:hypothetical protein [Candidatus Lokiarchaeota archaeon]